MTARYPDAALRRDDQRDDQRDDPRDNPRRIGRVVIALLLAGSGPTDTAAGPGVDDDLERCRWLHARIAHYTRLRRAGGSGVQMERWRRARQSHEAEYRQKRCHRYGSRLVLRP